MRERSTGGNTDDTNLGKWDKGSKSEYVTHEAGNYQSKTGSKITAETKTKTHRLCTREKQTWGQDRLGRQRNETERTEKLGKKNTNKWLRLNHKTHGNLENSIQQPDIIILLSSPDKNSKPRQSWIFVNVTVSGGTSVHHLSIEQSYFFVCLVEGL